MTQEKKLKALFEKTLTVLDKQAKRVRVVNEGHPDIVRSINETIIWVVVSRQVLNNLYNAANSRLQSSNEQLDVAVINKVVPQLITALQIIAKTKNWDDLQSAIRELAIAGAEQVSGAHVIGVLIKLTEGLGRGKHIANEATALLDSLNKLAHAHANWALVAQCQIFILKSQGFILVDDSLLKRAQDEV